MSHVIIVGQGPRSFHHPEDANIWVINGPNFPPRWDVLFQLHGLEHIRQKHGSAFVEWLGRIGKVNHNAVTGVDDLSLRSKLLYMTDRVEGSNAQKFPISDVMDDDPSRYLTGSFALVLALAMMQPGMRKPGAPGARITLDGVMFSGGSPQWGAGEGWAVPCIEYHIGRARARGIQVVVPRGCGLFAGSDFVYGFEGPGSV